MRILDHSVVFCNGSPIVVLHLPHDRNGNARRAICKVDANWINTEVSRTMLFNKRGYVVYLKDSGDDAQDLNDLFNVNTCHWR